VILSRREKSGDHDIITSEIILANIRVLAIDQAPREKDGQEFGRRQDHHARIEAGQAEILARARQTGRLAGVAQPGRCQRAKRPAQ